MEFFRYLAFFYRLTNRKIIIVVILAFLSSAFQSIALSAIATASEYGNNHSGDKNFITQTAYSLLQHCSINDERTLFAILLTVAAISFISMSAFLIFANIYIVDLQNSIYKRIYRQIMNDLMHADYEFFHSQSIGLFNNIATTQLRSVAVSFKLFANIIVLFISLAPFIIIAFAMNPLLSLLLAGILSPLLLPLRWINKKTRKVSTSYADENSRLHSVMIQIISHYKYLKATETYQNAFIKLNGIIAAMVRINRKIVVLGSLSSNAILPIAILLICALVYWQVAVQNSSVMSASIVLGFLYMASTRLNAIPGVYQKFLSLSGSIAIYRDLAEDLKNCREHHTDAKTSQADFTGHLVFDQVSFKYKTANEKALHQLSFTIPPRASVAFVGASGAGKSTLVNLIAGLLRPTSGTIRLSDKEYSNLHLPSLRKQLGYVTQEPVIFSDTVANNISLWDPSASQDAIIKAAAAAHADGFINSLPQKYDTMLGDNGVNISGGQRQRISIAREFYRATPFLIMDEATSALDSETEQIIQESIKQLHGKCTLLVIAHRLSTVKECDRIYVLDQGRLVEEGTYEELLALNGLFKRMVNQQSL